MLADIIKFKTSAVDQLFFESALKLVYWNWNDGVG